MVKINDTTTFPNTTPAPTDHVIGTDVSDTGNSADGEVVTFLLSDIANLNLRSSWHPYDLTSPTGTETGTIYDFSVDGAVASVESPTFEDGYEYAFVFDGVSSSAAATEFRMSLYRDTDAAYFTDTAILSGFTVSSEVMQGIIHVQYPRLSKYVHSCVPLSAGHVFRVDAGTVTVSSGLTASFSDATKQTTSKARFRFDTGNIDAGTIQMLRRREFLTG
jgi:hypothetical protein